MTKNEHVYVQVGGDAISAETVKTVEGHAVLNFEAATFSSFRDVKKNHFVTAAAADLI